MAKYSWMVLFGFALLLALSSFFILLTAEIDPNDFRSSTGVEWDAFKAEEPTVAAYTVRLEKLIAVMGIGFSLFGAVTAYKPYRNGEKWAWFTMFLFPIAFAASAVIFVIFNATGLGIYYGVFAVINLLALLIGFPNFSSKG